MLSRPEKVCFGEQDVTEVILPCGSVLAEACRHARIRSRLTTERCLGTYETGLTAMPSWNPRREDAAPSAPRFCSHMPAVQDRDPLLSVVRVDVDALPRSALRISPQSGLHPHYCENNWRADKSSRTRNENTQITNSFLQIFRLSATINAAVARHFVSVLLPDWQARQRESAASRPEDSREDAWPKMFPESAEC